MPYVKMEIAFSIPAGNKRKIETKHSTAPGLALYPPPLWWWIMCSGPTLTLNPLTAKLFNLNFHRLEVVSRWRDPQLQVSENYSDLTKWRWTVFKYCWLMSHFIFNMFKMWYLNVLIKHENPNICGMRYVVRHTSSLLLLYIIIYLTISSWGPP